MTVACLYTRQAMIGKCVTLKIKNGSIHIILCICVKMRHKVSVHVQGTVYTWRNDHIYTLRFHHFLKWHKH